jgi:VanZ family protein
MKRASGNLTEGIDLGSILLTLALLLEILAVAFGSLMPLTLVRSWATVRDALQAGLSLEIHPPIWATLSERLLTFLPMGLLAFLQMDRLGRRPVLLSVALTALVALAIEVAQATIIGRHPRLSDFLLATIFGCMGAAIGQALRYAMDKTSLAGRRRRSFSESVAVISVGSDRIWRWGLAGAVALCNAATLAILTTTHSGLGIAGWDCSYPLLVGNELTKERPWLGQLRGLAIYDRALDDTVIQQLSRLPMTADSSAARREAGARIVYAFDTANGSSIPNLGLADAADGMAARIDGSALWTIAGGAIDIRGPIVIQSNAPPKDLCQRILLSRSLTIEVELASANLSQVGPARIVSISYDTLQRDVTLGQESGVLDLRVRTPRRGPNGESLPIRTADGTVTGSWQHVLATYRNDVPQIFIDGHPAIASPDAHKLLLTDEGKLVPVAQITGFFYLAAAAASAVLLVGRSFPTMLLLGISAAAATPLLYAIALEAWRGYRFDWWHFGAAVVASSLGVVIGRSVVHHCGRQVSVADAGTHNDGTDRLDPAAHG